MFPVNPVLRKFQTKSGQLLWVDHDHVHLVPDDYRDLAAVVLEVGAEVESDEAASIASDSGKRMCQESVVTAFWCWP